MDTWFSIEKWWWTLLRKIAKKIAAVFIKLGISANQLTVGRFVIFAPCVLVGFSLSGYWGPVFGLVCLVTYGVLDFCDGTIARETNSVTKVGGWLDGRFDFILQVVVLSGATWHIINSELSLWWIGVAIAALFSQAVLVHFTDIYGGLFSARLDFFRDLDNCDGKLTILEKFIIDIIITRSNFTAIFFTFRYVVIVTVLLGHLEWLLLVVAITQNIRWLVLFSVMARFLALNGDVKGIWRSMWSYIDAEYTPPH